MTPTAALAAGPDCWHGGRTGPFGPVGWLPHPVHV